MVKLVNRAKMSTATTGTGTLTLGAAETGYQSFADGGVVDGDVVRYVIEDGDNWEIGSGTYAASGTTLTRTVSESSNADAAITLTGSAVVFVSTSQYDVPVVRDSDPAVDTNPPNVGAVWVNSTSGSMFVCTDNTVGLNSWREVDGSKVISVAPEVLVVAGGGGGGINYGGGGGGGGVLAFSLTSYEGQTFSVAVGAGGNSANGGNSSLGGTTALGGGKGAVNTGAALSGGSGGGGSSTGQAAAALGAAGTSGQGFKGGDGVISPPYPSGGGGGAGGAGGDGAGSVSGGGGIGAASSIEGSTAYYGSGGSGVARSGGSVTPPGLGGGGVGALVSGTGGNGTANTGGGGGGGFTSGGSFGGSGVVIARVLTYITVSATTGSPTVTTDGDFTIYKFTGSGSITF